MKYRFQSKFQKGYMEVGNQNDIKSGNIMDSRYSNQKSILKPIIKMI